MPKYVYSCANCNGCFQAWHGMKETQESCQLCNESDCLVRIPQLNNRKIISADEKVGDITQEFIHDNKQLLSDMKKEARKQIYED